MSGAPYSDVSCREGEREPFLNFLYAMPVGLAQLNPRGEIELANPEFARLARIVSDDFDFRNFFDFIEPLATELCVGVEAALTVRGPVFDDEWITLPRAAEGVEALAFTMSKTEAGGFLVVLRDATQTVRRERGRYTVAPNQAPAEQPKCALTQ